MNDDKNNKKHDDKKKHDNRYDNKTEDAKDKNTVTKSFIVKGTTCASCEYLVKEAAESVKGVKSVEFSYKTEKGKVTFDTKKTDIDEILSKIEENDQYECSILDNNKAGKDQKASDSFFSSKNAWIFIALGVLIAGFFLFYLADGITFPEISPNMGYLLLFVVGLLTGFHCVAMCGGFVLGYAARAKERGESIYKAHILYGTAKTISYTIIGAAFGLFGSIIAFTPKLRGTVGILAGIFMIIYGLNMLNLIPFLRNIRIPVPSWLQKSINKNGKGKGPFVIGLLNGLMIACGPLQAIYIMAAGTGSAIEGAKLLFVFGIGTLVVLLGFGLFASYISSNLKNNIVKLSGIIVAILGIIMLNNGLILLGSGYDFGSMVQKIGGAPLADSGQNTIENKAENTVKTGDSLIVMKDGYQEIRMTVDRNGYTPDKFVLEKGVPVKWIIEGKELTSCNKAIQVPSLNMKFDIKQGTQVIEFTPTETGIIPWSCWMGMIPGTFIVREGVSNGTVNVKAEIDSVQMPKSSGSCGCGGM